MLKNALSNGYSSKVRGWMVVDDMQHEIAQVGPDFCILREPLEFTQTQAELVVEVDGDKQTTSIEIVGSEVSQNRLVFARTCGPDGV